MVPETAQRSLFSEQWEGGAAEPSGVEEVSDFIAPDPERIFIGEQRLREYLEANGMGWVLRMREVLMEMDLTGIRVKYDPAGRRPIDPAVLLGLILYGMLMKQWSLRELEALARRDVGAWWLLGGLTPDHSTIGNFITRHEAELSGESFEALTRQLLKRLKIRGTDVAGDGTVIEAMASRYHVLKEEALREQVARMRKQAVAEPENRQVQEKAQRLEEASIALRERQTKREGQGKQGKAISISPVEPAAYVQPLKNKTNRPSYKPSVLANEYRIIVGQYVDASSETAAIEPMLDQHERVVGEAVARLSLDAGYSNATVFSVAIAREIDLLCPAGKAEQGQWEKRGPGGRFGKRRFQYQEAEDVYLCPAGNQLIYESCGKDKAGREYNKYRGDACSECRLRTQCTMSAQGRTVKRYAVDEYKEAMSQVLSQRGARKKYRQRKVIVEPVFSELRYRQGLTRFQRRGTQKVRVEFSLHCMAYNVRRACRLEDPGLFVCLTVRIYDKNSKILGSGGIIIIF